MNKKLFTIIMALILVSGTLQAQQAIKVGIFDLRPHMEYNEATKTARGAAVEYLNAVTKQMGYTVEWSVYPLPRLVAMMYAGELDCTLFLSKNPVHEEKLIYSDTPLLLIKPILVVKKESALKEIKTAAEIKGLKIGFLAAYNIFIKKTPTPYATFLKPYIE